MPGAGTSGSWRLVITAVRYQPRRILYVYGPDDVTYVVSGPTGRGADALAAAMAGRAGVGRITRQVAVDYAAAAGAVLVFLDGAALAVTRAILRPPRQAAEVAGTAVQAALREPPPVIPGPPDRVGPPGAEPGRGPPGISLAGISEQLRTSRAAEAAARRRADELAG